VNLIITCQRNLEESTISTIIDFVDDEIKIVRKGSVSKDEIEESL